MLPANRSCTSLLDAAILSPETIPDLLDCQGFVREQQFLCPGLFNNLTVMMMEEVVVVLVMVVKVQMMVLIMSMMMVMVMP